MNLLKDVWQISQIAQIAQISGLELCTKTCKTNYIVRDMLESVQSVKSPRYVRYSQLCTNLDLQKKLYSQRYVGICDGTGLKGWPVEARLEA